jgi:hypothetical protein
MKLEEGKCYITRDGSTTSPLECCDDCWYEADEIYIPQEIFTGWTIDGKCDEGFSNGESHPEYDLVSEFVLFDESKVNEEDCPWCEGKPCPCCHK